MGLIEEQDKLEKDLKKVGLEFFPGGQTKGMIGHLDRGGKTLIEIYEHAFYVQDWHYPVTDKVIDLIKRVQQWHPIEKVTRFY